jgi:hypothetical protein
VHKTKSHIALGGHFHLHNIRAIAVVNTVSSVHYEIECSVQCATGTRVGNPPPKTRQDPSAGGRGCSFQTGCAQHDVDKVSASSSTKLETSITVGHAAQGKNDATE